MHRPFLGVALALALTISTTRTAQASAAPQSQHQPPAAAIQPVAGPDQPAAAPARYRNPMALKLPGGQQASSCADPYVLRGQHPADHHWYLYCTSDALTPTQLNPDGTLVIHNIPTFTSTDLTHWSYVGDAFPTKPSWVLPSAGMWAPDVIYRNGTYFLYYAASDTALAEGGSAVGVATSTSPTGPWTDSGTPVVTPQGPAGAKRWEFDPEVITDGAKSYLYFGSYFGGIHARQLSEDGLTTLLSTETPIAIDNRYEGTFIVKHDGWYYFMGSAANCCAGDLTGYSVFAARSKSPLGPFLDRDGISILSGRVGGTPVLTQNGNKWIGTGHNAVITDYSGQTWIIYHAVDRTDPYYAGQIGYTKRPVLIDPLDWRNGWPTVRGGRGPSDTLMPGPVAQPGEKATYRAHFVTTPTPGHTYWSLSDDFDGTTLAARWTWIRPPAAGTTAINGGALTWQTQAADLHPPATPLASVLTEPAPRGDYLVETKVSVNTPADGCCQNYVQGGLVIYGGDGNYIKLASASIWDTRQTEFGKERSLAPAGYPTYGNGVAGPVGNWTYLRIQHHHIDHTDAYTAYTSLDGRNWDTGGTWTTNLGAHPKIGLISMGGAGFTSTFAYVHVSTISRRPADR